MNARLIVTDQARAVLARMFACGTPGRMRWGAFGVAGAVCDGCAGLCGCSDFAALAGPAPMQLELSGVLNAENGKG